MDTDTVEVVRQFFAVMQDEGPAIAARRFGTDDMVWWSPGFGEIQAGLEGMSALLDEHFVGGKVYMTIGGITNGGDRVAVEATSQGQLKSGPLYNNSYHWLFEFRGDKINRIKEYNDTAHLMELLGPVLRPA